MSDINALIKVVSPVVTGMGYELWGCELARSGRAEIVRIYIDKEKGIDVEDCARVSRQISAVLDVEDPISGEYVLEVSSPGMDRPLFYHEQFERYVGESIKLKLKVPKSGRRNFSGKLLSVGQDHIVLAVDAKEVTLECDNISRANLNP